MADAGDLRQFEAQARAARQFSRAAERLSDNELRGRTAAFRRRLAGGGRLEDLVPEALASVREAAWRGAGTTQTQIQLAAGAAVHAGRFVEMKDGEGKALTAILAAYLHALAGRGVHLVTVDDQRARRGAGQAAAVLGLLGLRVAAIDDGAPQARRAQAYAADVTYGAYRQFGYDYLRDNMAWQPGDRVQRRLHAAVVEETESILIDRAGELMGASGNVEPDVGQYRKLAELAAQLRSGKHFAIDEAIGAVSLTDAGAAQAAAFLGVDDLLRLEHARLAGSVADAIRAREWYRPGQDYAVVHGEVTVAGGQRASRLRRTTRFARGIRQAIEASRGMHISAEEAVYARISVAGYLRLYPGVGGLSATAVSAEALRATSGYQAANDDQSVQVYQMRTAILEAGDLHPRACQMIGEAVEVSVAANQDPHRLRDALAALYPVSLTAADLTPAGGGPAGAQQVTARAKADALAAYERRGQELGPAILRELEKKLMLGVIDREWREHLLDLDRLLELVGADDSVHEDPLDGYRHSAAARYSDFLRRVRRRIVSNLFFLEIPREAFQ